MNQLKTILVGVDFSECSRCALEQAVRLARCNNAGLNVIHVMDSSALDNAMTRLPPELDELRRINREHAIGRLAEWAKEAGAPDGHSREVMNGAPLDLLLQESRNRRVDLLVLGITGDSLLPYGAGTLATKCLRKSATKVLLVKQTHPRPFRRIVACVDFSETSKEVVKHALRVAGQKRPNCTSCMFSRPSGTTGLRNRSCPRWQNSRRTAGRYCKTTCASSRPCLKNARAFTRSRRPRRTATASPNTAGAWTRTLSFSAPAGRLR